MAMTRYRKEDYEDEFEEDDYIGEQRPIKRKKKPILENKEDKPMCKCKQTEEIKREFNFKLPSISVFLESEWSGDLSRENPLIVLRIGGYTHYLLHESIKKKAGMVGLPLPEITHTDKDIANLYAWVEHIKSQEWEDKKVDINVVIPKI